MLDHRSLSNPRNNLPNTRFRSFSGSRSRPRFGSFNQPLECYYCHCLGHTANNCFRWQNSNFPRRQPSQGRRNINTNIRNSRRYVNYRGNDTRNRNSNSTPQYRVNFSDPPMYFDLQIGNHEWVSIQWFPLSKKPHIPLSRFSRHAYRWLQLTLTIHWLKWEPLDILF